MEQLVQWHNKWGVSIYSLCTTNQQQAMASIWKRYLEALGTLYVLAANMRICDFYVIERVCLELHISFKAIFLKPPIAEEYIVYEKYFHKKYCEQMTKHGDQTQKEFANDMKQSIIEHFGSDYDQWNNQIHWHKGGVADLFKIAKSEDRLFYYTFLCQFSHGTIIGLKYSEFKGETVDLQKPFNNYFLVFPVLTEDLFKLIGWGPSIKNECIDQLYYIYKDFIV